MKKKKTKTKMRKERKKIYMNYCTPKQIKREKGKWIKA